MALLADAKGLTVLNRTLSSGTLFLLGLVLLLGPLSRVYKAVWNTLFIVRKELGVLTFFAGLLHVYLSMFPLARHGPWGLYVARPWSAYSGLLGLVLMAILFIFSFTKIERLLSPRAWWRLQYLGARTAFAGIVLHAILLQWSVWSVWLSGWIRRANVGYPPLSLLVIVFSLYVVIVRLIERYDNRLGVKRHLTWLTVGTSALIASYFI